MPFRFVNGRPDGTQATDQGVVHYTCNAPSPEQLGASGIVQLGEKFGVGNREVLLIPDSLFVDRGLPKDTIGAEIVLRNLTDR